MWLILVLIAIFSIFIYAYFFKKSSEFWKEYGINQVQHSGFRDNLGIILGKKTIGDLDEVVYFSLPENEKFCGFVQMQSPFLLVKDLDIVKKILIKDFDHFVDRRPFCSTTLQPVVSKMLGNLEGDEWKGVRSSLSPTFTTGKIRRMMECFNTVSNDWTSNFKERIKSNNGQGIDIDVAKETGNYTVDVISNSVYGMSVGTIKNPDSTFSKMVQKLSNINFRQMVRMGVAFFFPNVARLLRMKIFDPEAMDFFESLLLQGMNARMSGAEKRNDFLQLIAEARKGEVKAQGSDELGSFEKDSLLNGDHKNDQKNWLDDDIIALAQMLSFFFAGYSTTSNFLGFLMYNLALNPDCQDKLRKEIDRELFKDGSEGVDYDVLNNIEYLEMCVCETLRKFPPLARLERLCTKDYMDIENNIKVPKGAFVGIPIQAIHNDTNYYEFPAKFHPEHFSQANKSKRSPYAYLPFGTGPRNCIGMRFALVETKAALAHILHHFELSPSKKTPVPLKTKATGLGVQLPDKLELKLSPIIKT